MNHNITVMYFNITLLSLFFFLRKFTTEIVIMKADIYDIL